MPTRLKDLETTRVALVDLPAIRRKWLIMKREGNKMGEMKLDQEKDENLEALDEELAEDLEKAELSEEAVAALKAALKSLNKFMDEFPNELKRDLNTLARAIAS